MRNIRGITFGDLFITLVFLAGCQKSGSNCLTSNGPVIRQERVIEEFDSIDIKDNVNLILTQDSINSVVVEAGKNIIDGITIQVVNSQLLIGNTNNCNWLRSYESPLNVYVSFKNLRKIYYNCSGNVQSVNAIKSPLFKVEAWGGCGTIDLILDIQEGYFIQHMGTADFILHGHCPINSIYAGDYGPFHCEDLSTSYLFITNKSSNDCRVNVSHYLDATIESIGNIWYKATPDTIVTHINGSGKLIPY